MGFLSTKSNHYINSKFLLLVNLMIIALLLSGCGQTETKPTKTDNITVIDWQRTTTPPLTSSSPNEEINHVQRWLKGIPCKSPCFENITPGKTKASEVLEIMKQNPVFGGVKIWPTIFPNETPLSIYWYWAENTAKKDWGSANGELKYENKPKDDIITIISAKIGSYTLEDVIRVYGEPGYIFASLRQNPDVLKDIKYDLYLIYLDQGFYVYNSAEDIPKIQPEMQLQGVTFFAPVLNMENFIALSPPYLIRKWEGFKDYRYYCLRDYGKEFVENCNDILDKFKQ
jgi:hypothetical protein